MIARAYETIKSEMDTACAEPNSLLDFIDVDQGLCLDKGPGTARPRELKCGARSEA